MVQSTVQSEALIFSTHTLLTIPIVKHCPIRALHSRVATLLTTPIIKHCPIRTLHSRLATLLIILMIALREVLSKSLIVWGKEFSLTKTVSESLKSSLQKLISTGVEKNFLDKKFLSPTSTLVKIFFVKTISVRDRVPQSYRKLGQDGPCSIYTREKSHRLHSYPPKPLFGQDKKFLSPTSTGMKKSNQDGPSFICTREKSHRLHSGPPKPLFYTKKVIKKTGDKDSTTLFIHVLYRKPYISG